MTDRVPRHAFVCGLSWALILGAACRATAAPQINNLSLRGLQAGGVTTLVIDGSELLPEPHVLLGVPQAKITIKDGATPARLEIEIALDGQTAAGIYPLRVASASGISEAVTVGVDNLPQIPFAPQLAVTNVAVSGSLNGSMVLTTSFAGKKDQDVIIEVESRRLGAKLEPVIHLYNARRTQVAWSQGLPFLAGDARLVAKLPADGPYTIELHDAVYRGGDPGFFRLKVGQFHYANLAYPLAVQQGTTGTFQFALANLPADARSTGTWTTAAGLPLEYQPAPWPAGTPLLSGSRPVVIASNHLEVVEVDSPKLQEIPQAPVAINGRIITRGHQDRYRLAVTPGATLFFDVLARRAGSPLDGVLSIQNEQGAELVGGDDVAGSTDPSLTYKVPDGVNALVVGVRDLQGRGGDDFVYRISITPAGQPDFKLSLESARYLVPKDGVALVRVKAARTGYNGPIKISFGTLPASMSITGDEIPAGATEALVTLSAPGLSPAQALTTVVGSSTEPNTAIKRAALPPANIVTRYQPWLGDEVAVAVTTPAPLNLVWDLFPTDTKLAQGTALPVKLRVQRAGGVTGAVRLKLLTTQVTPRKKVKVNNVDQEVDDVDRTLRFEAAPTIAADQSEATAKILVPADLPQIAFDLAIEAELLSADGKNVVTSAVTPARRMTATTPIALELASSDPIEARAGLGPTGKLTGKVNRSAGFALPVNVSLSGLPKGVASPTVTVPGDKSEFELPVAFPYGTAEGDLKDVKLVGTSQVDPKNPKLMLRTGEVAVAVKVVKGDKPPTEKPLAIFEDQPEFIANLKEGDGQATINGDEKYSGGASVKVTPGQRFNPALPGLGLKIREKPGPGEFRFLRFAWKKQGGQVVCLQLNHDGLWGPSGTSPAKFRYHAGPGPECFNGSVVVDANLPAAFTVVTRDLFADFGEFTLTGIGLSPMDGEFALFDHIYLGTTPEDFDLVKP